MKSPVMYGSWKGSLTSIPNDMSIRNCILSLIYLPTVRLDESFHLSLTHFFWRRGVRHDICSRISNQGREENFW